MGWQNNYLPVWKFVGMGVVVSLDDVAESPSVSKVPANCVQL
jgi:hypothetical protein